MGIIVAGERSGVGKTTITLALLAGLIRRGKSLQSFKVGPDYIDCMFHCAVTNRPCRNLDPILTSEDYVRWCFDYYTQFADIAVVEGVMGLFDGVPYGGYADYGSTAHVARLLGLPVIFIVDCSKISGSVGAIALGYSQFDPDVKIGGIILNKVASEKHLSFLKAGLKQVNIPIVGVWYRYQKIELPSRHLGLIPTDEINHHREIFDNLADLAEDNFDWQLVDKWLKKEKKKDKLSYFISNKTTKFNIKVAIARDKSFNFYYQDNLDILSYLGVELIEVSPLEDDNLPSDIQGIYLGGGFPEIFASQLSANHSFKVSLKAMIEKGIPTYAECGGMMYLSQGIEDFEGKNWTMVGVLPHFTVMSQKLTLGYREVRILTENNFLRRGEVFIGHEFHRAIDSFTPPNPLLELKDFSSQKIVSYQGWQKDNIFASYVHIHFANFLPQVERFLELCSQFK